MFRLALNAGHGIYTPGKRCDKRIDPNQTREWVLNDRICDKIENKLKAYEGYELIRLDDTTGYKDIALLTRITKANNFKADFYLSIHHDAGINGGRGGGITAFVHPNASAKSFEWRKELYDEIIKNTGLKGNRATPLNTANFYECRMSNMPCVLIECGFMDSLVDTPIILTDKYAEQVADACVKAIVRKGNLKTKEASVKDVTSNISYFAKYTGTGVSIVNALKAIKVDSSFAYRKKIAAKNNIKAYIGSAKQNTQMLKLLKQGKLIKP